MNVKIKHVYGGTEAAAANFMLQNPNVPDGDNGSVITATIRNAPSHQAAVFAANQSIFWQKLTSVDYSQLGLGRLIQSS